MVVSAIAGVGTACSDVEGTIGMSAVMRMRQVVGVVWAVSLVLGG